MRWAGFYFGPAILAFLPATACHDEKFEFCSVPAEFGSPPCKHGRRPLYVYDANENACKRVFGCVGKHYGFASEKRCERRCVAVCGDGRRHRSEECDDGNDRPGDGCSADCTLEGTVLVDAGATSNSCPRIESYSASPLETGVGSAVELAAAVVDAEGDPWELRWSASAGNVVVASDPRSAEYQCTVAGRHTVTLNLSGGEACEEETKQIEVICSP
jgi:cysteine-rich repeat protein